MLTYLTSFWHVLLAFLGLVLIIVVHELGHFLVARWCGASVSRFSVFFGRPVFSWTMFSGNTAATRFSVGWLPLGGYVKILGHPDVRSGEEELAALKKLGRDTTPFEDRRKWFCNISRQRQIAILLGGIAMNCIMSIVIFTGFAWVYGDVEYKADPIVSAVQPNSPAEQAGLLAGDRILSIDQLPVEGWVQAVAIISRPSNEARHFEIERDRRRLTFQIVPKTVIDEVYGVKVYRVGIVGPKPEITQTDLSLGGAVVYGTKQVGDLFVAQAKGIYKLVTGQYSLKHLNGPVGIINAGTQETAYGFESWLWFTAMLSTCIAFFNLLPIPLLDGGWALFSLLGWVRGKDLPIRLQYSLAGVALCFLLTMTVIGTWNDIIDII